MAPSQVPERSSPRSSGPSALLVAKPLTFMNRSGDAVAALRAYYDVGTGDLLVVVDEAACRSAGCARGRADRRAGTTVSSRSSSGSGPRSLPGCGWGSGAAMRGGISRITCSRRFEPDERAELEAFIARAADAAEMFAAEGIEKVMNEYNPDATASGSRLTPCCRGPASAGPDEGSHSPEGDV